MIILLPCELNFHLKVRAVNSWIYDFNREATGVQLDLGAYGVDGDPMVGEVMLLSSFSLTDSFHQ